MALRSYDAIIVGAGAAGLMCAIEAGKRGRSILVLDLADRIGKKILISGGGRCNFTNRHCRPENFLSANPHFCKSALARYTPADFIALVEKHRIPYHEKTLGQLFCDHSARNIVSMLEEECRTANVTILTNTRVHRVARDTNFLLSCGETEYRAHALVIATGGLSIPKMGATAFGYELAKQFGVDMQPCRPALVPFILQEDDRQNYCSLSGISAEVIANCDGSPRFLEKLLITHRGLSGPAILQASSYWKDASTIRIDLAPERDLTAPLREQGARRDLDALRTALRAALPARLADRWLELHPPAGWSNHALAELEHTIHHWELTPKSTEGYEKAEVTAGGVDTNELSAKTMECRRIPGLFFIGEVVDVTGHLGGFNFQWAWASGFSAGQAL